MVWTQPQWLVTYSCEYITSDCLPMDDISELSGDEELLQDPLCAKDPEDPEVCVMLLLYVDVLR